MDLKNRWNRFANARAGSADYFSLTSSHYSLTRALLPLIEKHVSGKTLDLGAGHGAYRPVLERCGSAYTAIDLQLANKSLDVWADGRELPFPNNYFDSVFSSQVLEHTPEPQRLLAEAYRVLAPGGALLISVPHLSYLHALPHDYYRYTNYGLDFLLRRAGFAEVETRPAGGVISLLGSVPQSLALALLPQKPAGFIRAALALNRLVSRFFVAIDDVADKGGLFALNFIAVARK